MEVQKQRPKAKRKLSNISFENEGAHIAIVSKDVGGPANGHDKALILKSTKQFSEEFIQKFQQVKVTMELPEFISRFFDIYYTDSLVLATLMGYEIPEDSNEYEDSWLTEYIEERVKSIELMKKLHKSKEISSVISEFSENDYLTLLKDQEGLEKLISKASLIVNKGLKNKANQEETMTTKTEKEVVEKSALEEVQKAAEQEKEALMKALNDQKEELQKALESVKKFEQEKKEAITKSRLESVKDAVKDVEKADIIFKALNLLEDETEFASVVKTLKDITELVDKGEMFVEKGLGGENEGAVNTVESKVTKMIKAQIEKSAKLNNLKGI